MKVFLHFLFITAVASLACAEKNNETAKLLKASLIVPCCAKHSAFLFPLLKEYEEQTELPDEVVISLSESDQVSQDIITTLCDTNWLFPVKLLLSKKKLYAGENRNHACEHATGDIFICQDADDIAHPQRIEIIKFFFNKYHPDHLMHQFYIQNEYQTCQQFEYYDDLNMIPHSFPKTFAEAWNIGRIQNGNPSLARKVFETMQWSDMPKGQDVEYNQRVYAQFTKNMILHIPLQCYRNCFSSHRIHNKQETNSRNLKHHKIEIVYLD